MTKSIRRILGVLVAVATLAACGSAGADGGSGSGGDGGGTGGFACNSTDFLVLGSTTFTETESSAYPPNCDPQVLANHFDDLGGGGPGFNVLVSTGFNGASFSRLELNMNIYGDTTGTYPASSAAASAPGTFGASVDTVVGPPTSSCVVTGGSLNLTKVEAAGGKVEGTFSFTSTATLPGGTSCGTYTGSFSATRNDL
jgi:hypothetical protein